jgi:hypothetical protein
MGHRDASGWVVDAQTPLLVKTGTSYNIMLAVNGLTATVIVDNKISLSKTFTARVVDGYSFGLNWGLTGVGSDNARGTFDNIKVQVIAPEATTVKTDELTNGPGAMFSGQAQTGAWSATIDGRYAGTPLVGTDAAVQLLTLGVPSLQALSMLELNTKLSTSAQGGFVFDYYSSQDYKFVLVDAVADKVLIGHRTAKGGVVIDASISKPIDTGTDYTLGTTLKGSTVSVTLNGQMVLSYSFNALAVDGRFGLLSRDGSSSFDVVTVKTNDTKVAKLATTLMADVAPATVVAGEALGSSDLSPLLDEALRRWAISNGVGLTDAMRGVGISLVDLPGLALGAYEDGRILIDLDAAGHGWFIDRTPGDDFEYVRSGDVLLASSGDAAGRMDLLSVIEHELGHALGWGHTEDGVMSEMLAAGTRTTTAVTTTEPRVVPGALMRIEPEFPGLVPAVPMIDWSSLHADTTPQIVLPTPAKAPAWQSDFVNHLARSEAQRNPNASLRVQINVAPKVSANLSTLHSSV